MRVVAGGAWHNLVFWGILVAVAGVSKGWIWGLVGYDDVSRSGKVVLGIDEVSWNVYIFLVSFLISVGFLRCRTRPYAITSL